MNNSFLQPVEAGKNAWWRYVVGILFVLIAWVLGSTIIAIPAVLSNSSESSPLGLALGLLGYAPMLIAPMLVTRWLHGRPAATLFGPERRLNRGRIMIGALVWLALSALASLVEFVLRPNVTYLNANFLQGAPLVIVALFLIPLQTSAEEVFFRGYLLQATGRLTKNIWALSVINAVLFTLPHLGNPEVEMSFVMASLNWFVSGFLYAFVTLRSGTLDYALAMHAVNNLFAFTIVGYEGGGFPPFALFVNSSVDLTLSLVSLVTASVIAILILGRQQAGARAAA